MLGFCLKTLSGGRAGESAFADAELGCAVASFRRSNTEREFGLSRTSYRETLMAKKRNFNNGGKRNGRPTRSAPPPAPLVRTYTPPPVYGDPFTLVEDKNKNTFVFQGGAWVAYHRPIAECKTDCEVKELPQRVNQMIRYQVRPQVDSDY